VTVIVHHENAPDAAAVTSTVTVSDNGLVGTPAKVTAVEGTDSGTVKVATFTDPGGAEAVSDYSATVDWGDGSAVDPKTTIALAAGVFTVSGHHRYAEESGASPYVVTVTLHRNPAGVATVVKSSATVSDPRVAAHGGFKVKGVEGADTGKVVLATFTDPGGVEQLRDYSATVVWGPHSLPDNTAVISYSKGIFTVSGHHKYAEETLPSEPTFTITVVVHHDHAPDAAVVTDTATVSDPQIVAKGNSKLHAVQGTSTGLVTVATFTDPGGPGEVVYRGSINWGDGSTVQAVSLHNGGIVSQGVVHGLATFLVQGRHTFLKSGNMTVTVTLYHTNVPVVVRELARVSHPSQARAVPSPKQTVQGVAGPSTNLLPQETSEDLVWLEQSHLAQIVNNPFLDDLILWELSAGGTEEHSRQARSQALLELLEGFGGK
jgi:hypothetical protein